MIVTIVIALAWALCGVRAYLLAYAHGAARYPLAGRCNVEFAVVIGMLGPIGLMVALFLHRECTR